MGIAVARQSGGGVTMLVKEIMTANPACCTPDTPLREVAQQMVEHDCGEIPVVRSSGDQTLVGVVTDRDIVCRLIAAGKNPLESRASDCMSSPVVEARESTPLEECARIMEGSQIRRLPVVDGGGKVCGIVSQADIAKHASRRIVADLVKDVSEPGAAASKMATH